MLACKYAEFHLQIFFCWDSANKQLCPEMISLSQIYIPAYSKPINQNFIVFLLWLTNSYLFLFYQEFILIVLTKQFCPEMLTRNEQKIGPKLWISPISDHFCPKIGLVLGCGCQFTEIGVKLPQFHPQIVVKLVLWLWLGVVLHILIGLGLWLGVSKPHFAHPWS